MLNINAILFWVLVSLTSLVYANNNFIIVVSSEDKMSVDDTKKKVQQTFLNSEKISFELIELKDSYSLRVGPFFNTKSLILHYIKIREVFPKSFIFNEPISVKPRTKTVNKIVYVEKEDETLWRALFGLAIIGIISLFLSSDQLKNLKKKHIRIQEKQDEIETRQTLLIERMGEQIQEVAMKNVNEEKLLLSTDLLELDQATFTAQIENIKQCDENLLHATYEMIDFLKIKSGNVIIKEEIFQLSGMLHKLTNALSPILNQKKHTLSYHIQPNITRYLVGDTGRILQILRNLLSDVLAEEEGNDIVLGIKIKNEEDLVFSIINKNQFLTKEEVEDMFFPCSWEELQKTNKEFSFFVLKELISRMGGELHIESDKRQGTMYEVILPYIKDIDNRDGQKKLKEALSYKKALVIDDTIAKAKNLIMILESFGIEVVFKTSDHLAKYRPDINGIDFVVIREEDVTKKVFDYFKTVNKDNILDIVVIHNVFETDKVFDMAKHLANAELYQPLIIGDVQEVLTDLCLKKSPNKKVMISKVLDNFKIIENIDVMRTDFKVFKNKHVLLVEDNIVSQQFLSIILSASELIIHQVNNGLEALLFLSEHPNIDLVLLDIDMPIMDGYEVAKKMRKDDSINGIPIIAVTGLGFTSELEQMVFSGIDHVIIKPFKIGHIYTALKQVFNEGEVPLHQLQKEEKKDIVDTDKGLAYVGNSLFYKEFIEQVLLTLEDSGTLIKIMIENDEIDKLKAFCVDALGLTKTIGAVRFVKLLKEMLVAIKDKEEIENRDELLFEEDEISLHHFISSYKGEWFILKREIEAYLRS